MRVIKAVFVMVVIGLLSVLSCSLSKSPSDTVEQFYALLNVGEYAKAKELYNSEAKQVAEGQLLELGGGFSKFADLETRFGTIREINIVNSRERGEGAAVDYEIVYKDGSSVNKTVRLTKEKGWWRLGLIP